MQAPLANNFTTNGVSLPIQVEPIIQRLSCVVISLPVTGFCRQHMHKSVLPLTDFWHDVLATSAVSILILMGCLQAHPLLTVLHP